MSRSTAASKTPFGQLAIEPKAGDTTLTFSSPVSGWQPGDELDLPDTRQLDWNQRGNSYVPQWEFPTIAGVSPDGLTVTLTSPLVYDHQAPATEAACCGTCPRWPTKPGTS